MKTGTIVFMLFLNSICLFARHAYFSDNTATVRVENITGEKDTGTWVVEEPATFKGNDSKAFFRWFVEHFQYPADAVNDGIFLKIVVQFCIDKTGKICDIKFLYPTYPSLEKEVIRVLESSPKWKPARNNHVKVKQTIAMPISINLQ